MGDGNICKDFQKNVCFRGDSCKYEHPGEDKDAPIKLTFCGQFQNGQCTFKNCQYIHASARTEQEYGRSGIIPSEVARDVIDRYNLCIKHIKGECTIDPCKFKHTNLNFDISGLDLSRDYLLNRSRSDRSRNRDYRSNNANNDLCKDYINGRCQRGNSCKFSHASPEDCGGNGPPDRKRRMMDDGAGQNMWRGGGGMGMRGGNSMGMGGGNNMGMGGGNFMGMGGGNGMSGGMGPTPDDYISLQRENQRLSMENSELRREMDGLKATNKFLLEETANMRLTARTVGTEAPGMGNGFSNMRPMGTHGNMGAGGTHGNMGAGRTSGNMGAVGSTADQQGYRGDSGQQVNTLNTENKYSQDREGNLARRDEGGRW